MFLFSILVLLVDTRMAVSASLLLSISALFVVKRPIRLMHDISLVTFTVALPLSFTLFTSLPLLNRFVIVEVIFVLLLVVARLSRERTIVRVARSGDLVLKNGLKGSFRAASHPLRFIVTSAFCLPFLFNAMVTFFPYRFRVIVRLSCCWSCSLNPPVCISCTVSGCQW